MTARLQKFIDRGHARPNQFIWKEFYLTSSLRGRGIHFITPTFSRNTFDFRLLLQIFHKNGWFGNNNVFLVVLENAWQPWQ
jgi:hypothetical protein